MNGWRLLAFKQTVNMVIISSEDGDSPPLKSPIASLYEIGFTAWNITAYQLSRSLHTDKRMLIERVENKDHQLLVNIQWQQMKLDAIIRATQPT